MTVLVFGLAPSIHASKSDVVTVLKDASRSNTASRRHVWATAFLAAQVALSVVLLGHFAVAVRTDIASLPSESILDTPEIVTAALTLPAAAYPTTAERATFYDALLARVRGVTAINGAALTSTLPYFGGDSTPVSLSTGSRPTKNRPARAWSSRSHRATSMRSVCRFCRAVTSMRPTARLDAATRS